LDKASRALELKTRIQQTFTELKSIDGQLNKQPPRVDNLPSCGVQRIRLNIELERRIDAITWVIKKFAEDVPAYPPLPYRQLSFLNKSDCIEIEQIKMDLKKSLEVFTFNSGHSSVTKSISLGYILLS
jgi:hypothetical protein